MAHELGEPIEHVARKLAGGDLLAVTVYTEDDISHQYICEPLMGRIEELDLEVLHRPVKQIHHLLGFISRLNHLTGDYEASSYAYEQVTYFHFPKGKSEGVIVSLAPDIDLSLHQFQQHLRDVPHEPDSPMS